MEHNKTTLASDDEHEIAIERCDCGQYSLSMGPVTIQLEESVVVALSKMLSEVVENPAESPAPTPSPSDIQ